MALSYAGIPLPLPTPELAAWVEDKFSLRDVIEFQGKDWPGSRLNDFLTFPGTVPKRPIRLCELYWPRDASRFATFHGLICDSDLATLRNAVFPGFTLGQATYVPLPLVMTEEDPSGNVVNSITTNMYMLPNRAFQLPYQQGDDGVYLLSLVDERYFWWLVSLGVLTVTEGTTAWTDLYTAIGTALGVTISVDPVNANYGKPPSCLGVKYEYVPIILDAIAYNVGQRIVRHLDGTVFAQNNSTHRATITSNLINPAGGTWPIQAGAQFNAEDQQAVLPVTVLVTFPRKDDGIVNSVANPYTVSVAAGGQKGTKVFRDVALAIYTAGVIQNASDLLNLATQIETDYVAYQTPILDMAFPGIVPWVPEGQSDCVEWMYGGFNHALGQLYTRVRPSPFNDLTEDTLHAPTGGAANVIGGSGGNITINNGVVYINIPVTFNQYITLNGFIKEVATELTLTGGGATRKDNWDIGFTEWVEVVVNTGAVLVSGMIGDLVTTGDGLGNVDGRHLIITNLGPGPLWFSPEDANSTISNRIDTALGEAGNSQAPVPVWPLESAGFKYDGSGSTGRWKMLWPTMGLVVPYYLQQSATNITLSSATINDLDIGNTEWVRASSNIGGGNIVVNSILADRAGDPLGGAATVAGNVEGRELHFQNLGTSPVNFTHQAAAGTASARIITPTGLTVTVPVNGWAFFKYDATLLRWMLILLYPVTTGGPTGTNAWAALVADFDIKAAGVGGAFYNVGGNFTLSLPAAGTYLVQAVVPCTVLSSGVGAAGQNWISARLFNTTDAAEVGGGGAKSVVVENQTVNVEAQGSATLAWILTITAAKTIDVQAGYFGAGNLGSTGSAKINGGNPGATTRGIGSAGWVQLA